jgi:hypothetical protein
MVEPETIIPFFTISLVNKKMRTHGQSTMGSASLPERKRILFSLWFPLVVENNHELKPSPGE